LGQETVSSAHKLVRQVFTKKRQLDFFNENGLAAQIGYARRWWPAVLLKELLDNALDICESADIVPTITVTVTEDSLTVSDNGTGLPASTLETSLNYELRVSDKIMYVAPTRGQLGNALKTVWVLPYVASDDARGLVEVDACGIHHRITISGSSQDPQIVHTTQKSVVKNGTILKVTWPGLARSQGDSETQDFYSVVKRFALLNPHANFHLKQSGSKPIMFRASLKDWQKWRTDQPTSSHWYSVESFRNLLGAYISNGQGDKSVREFVSEFDGLRGSQYQRKVVAQAKVSGQSLADLSADAIERLLAAMKEATREVVPQRLGLIGEDHFRKTLVALGVSENSFEYKKKLGSEGGLPFAVEAAFGSKRTLDHERDLLLGLNFSPTFKVPSDHLESVLGDCWIGERDSVVLAVHQVSPRLMFTSLGKGDIEDAPAVRDALSDLVERVTRRYHKMKARAFRQQEQQIRQEHLDELDQKRSEKEQIKQAAYSVMAQAYALASGNGTLPANARQMMYAARPLVLKITGDKCWKNTAYFTQKLLPYYVEEYPEQTKGWDVHFDARGHLLEPHAQSRLSLGTLEVRAYLRRWQEKQSADLDVRVPTDFPTCGPANRYRFALFVEKEGFDVLLDRSGIANRFDIAIFSTKGVSTTTARELVDRLSQAGVTTLIVHDFDKSGLTIMHTLVHDTWRYQFKTPPKYVDLGLRLADVQEMKLESEPIPEKMQFKDPREVLREYGASEEECDFLVEKKQLAFKNGKPRRVYAGKRVELNAMTAPQFINWLERKLIAAGAQKVIPNDTTLGIAYRRAKDAVRLNEFAEQIQKNPTRSKVPRNLREQVQGILKREPAMSWDGAVARIAGNKSKREA
jgi:DNA topoisomerase VI subunit B